MNSPTEASGIVNDIVNAAFSEVGFKTNYRMYPFPRAVAALLNANTDAGFFDPSTLETVTKKKHLCSVFFQYNAVLFYTKKNSRFENINLKEKLVGVLRGNNFEVSALKSKGMKVESVHNHASLFKMLSLSRIDFASTVDLTGFSTIKENFREDQWEQFKIVKEPYYKGKAGLCFSGKNAILNQATFLKGLNLIRDKGIFKKIVKKYLSKNLYKDIDQYYQEYWDGIN